jgi:2-polyprenyl-3-methyl-5-hydroxy-6-metoxy-1,4-benzoquinol methylase
MPTELIELTEAEQQAREEFSGRLFMAGLQALELFTVWLGDALGLFAALAESGDVTSAELAKTAGVDERYAREWLEQQATAGIVEVAITSENAFDRRYRLPKAHHDVLLNPDSPFATLPLAQFLPSIGRVEEPLLAAYRNGGGVPYADYGVHDAQAAFTRPAFVNDLVTTWIPALPDLETKLRNGGKVAEIACGEGVAAVALATAYPISIDGFDLDDASIAHARRLAADAGVSDRARFEVRDATDTSLTGSYDVVLVFEALHDVARPVELLATLRRLCAPGGTVIVADERVAEEFSAPGDEFERFCYAASVLHCLPVGMTEAHSAGTGAVIRPATVRAYAEQAGFTSVDQLPLESTTWRFYQLEV